MAKSWASETKEKVNYTKLCRLLYDGGTLAVRTVFDGIVPPASLAAELTTNKTKLLNLKKPKGKVLNQDQWDLLYPSGASPTSEQYDITLLFVLLRNIYVLTPPPTGWDRMPPSTNTSQTANLVRIKFYRNTITAHCPKAEIDDTQFECYWNDISVVLVALGLKQSDIDDLKSAPLGENDYKQLVEYWYLSDQEIKQHLETLTSDTSTIIGHTTDLKSSISKMESDIAEMKDSVKPGNIAINKLAHRNFDSTTQRLCDKCHPNTREWLMNDVKSRVNQDSYGTNIQVIQAGPGMGKSVVAAKLCQDYKSQGVLGGCHFFKHDNSLLNNPRLMLQSVARQLCDVYPEYRNSLSESLSKNLGKEISDFTCNELFTLLFEEPCSNLKLEGFFVIIIDAIDECCNTLKMELFQTLRELHRLPSWLRFVLTTRPPPNISSLDIPNANNYTIAPKDDKNTNDLQIYMTDKLEELGNIEVNNDDTQLRQLVKITEGYFLVAYFVVDLLRNSNINSLPEAVEQFPKGISAVYEDYFLRLHKALIPHIHSEDGFYDMLEAVTAAKYPIEKTMFYSILGVKDKPRVPNRERKEAINLLHQLFPVENDHVSAFHKTAIDWLTTGDHDFSVKGDGCDVLANQCYSIINTIKDSAKPSTDQSPSLTDCDTYALKYAPLYIKESKAFSKETKREMETDPAILCLQAFSHVEEEYKRREAMNYASKIVSSNIADFEDCLSGDCHHIYDWLKSYFSHKRGDCSLKSLKHLTYTELLHLTYQAAYLLQIGDTEKTLNYLQENSIPYIESVTLLDMEEKEQIKQIVGYNSGFLVVVQDVNEVTLLRKHQLDGKLAKEVPFSQFKEIHMSPNDEFIAAVSLKARGDIEIIDTTSFDVKTTYQCPNVVKTCHVFGKQPWYILFRCFNNKLYIVDGETGEFVVDPVQVRQNEVVLKVSNQGDIVLARTSESFTSLETAILTEKFNSFTDEDGHFCESMIWSDNFNIRLIENRFFSSSERFNQSIVLSRKLFLCKFQKLDENMPIFSRCTNGCICPIRYCENPHCLMTQGQPVCFSEDGKLLAFYYHYHITVVHTSDGSLYKSVCLSCLHLSLKDILHLTNEDLFIYANGSADYLLGNAMFCSQIRFGESKYDFKLNQILYIPSNVDILCTIKSDNNLKSLMVQQFPVEHRFENNTKDILKLDFHI